MASLCQFSKLSFVPVVPDPGALSFRRVVCGQDREWFKDVSCELTCTDRMASSDCKNSHHKNCPGSVSPEFTRFASRWLCRCQDTVGRKYSAANTYCSPPRVPVSMLKRGYEGTFDSSGTILCAYATTVNIPLSTESRVYARSVA